MSAQRGVCQGECLARRYLPEGCLPSGVSAQGGVCPGGVSAQGGMSARQL